MTRLCVDQQICSSSEENSSRLSPLASLSFLPYTSINIAQQTMKLHNPLLTPHNPHHSLIPSLESFYRLDAGGALPTSWTSISALKDYYLDTSTNPLHPALLFCGAISMVVWFLGEVTGTSFPLSLFPSLSLLRSERTCV